MSILTIVLAAFVVLETLNIILLYKMPGSTMGNAVGVFRAYAKTQEDPEIKAFVNYLINWVAGTKLIFVVLIIGIIITGSPETQVYSTFALIFSIATFFTQLYPILKTMDEKDQLEPRGYSRTLARMIGAFIFVFVVALVVYLVRYFVA